MVNSTVREESAAYNAVLEEGAVYVYKRMYRARVWYVRGQSDVCRGVCERSVKCVSCV